MSESSFPVQFLLHLMKHRGCRTISCWLRRLSIINPELDEIQDRSRPSDRRHRTGKSRKNDCRQCKSKFLVNLLMGNDEFRSARAKYKSGHRLLDCEPA